ncbi:MAG TPA: flagellar hook-associated protein 3, partial [Desulfobacterales bacterium]|nr:flagellar hook-associated protein 3 [Desulfobacterales bacterium]
MRVATKSMYENIKVNLVRTTEALVAANNMVSTGERVNKLSDDPVAMVSVMG